MPTPIKRQFDVPIGGIIDFSGSFGGTNNRFPIDGETGEINTCWCLCDGITTNGRTVPDLRGKFVRGADNNYPSGSIGGSDKHTHTMSGSVGSTTLTTSSMPSHTHGVDTGVVNGSGCTRAEPYEGVGATCSVKSTGDSGSHTHSLTDAKVSSGSSLPAFYSLAKIMRIS